MALLRMKFSGNRGYGPDQVDSMTLGDLLEVVQEAVIEWGEDATFAPYQTNNGHGANYGELDAYDLFEEIPAEGD